MLPSWYPSPEAPYAGTFFRAAARAVAAAGQDVTVLYPQLRSLKTWRPGAGFGRRVDAEDGAVREIRWDGFRWWPRERHGTVAFTHAARRLFYEYVSERGEPDLVHAHVVLPAGHAARRIGEAWDVPFVLSEHAGPFSMMLETPWQRGQVRRAYRGAAAVTAVSEHERRAMCEAGIEREIEVVPNVLDAEFVGGSLAPRRAREGTFRLLCLASLRPGKGHEELLRAIARIRRDKPGGSSTGGSFTGGSSTGGVSAARLVLAGEGPLRGELAALARTLGVRDAVEFAAAPTTPGEVREAVDGCDALVLASRAETFGVVLIEALARGRPVLATRCGGPEEIVSDGNGLLVAAGDVDALAGGIVELIRRAGAFNPERIAADCAARFGPAAVAARYTAIYEQVVAATASRRT